MHALDALVLEPHSGLLAAINGESGLVLLIDIEQAKVIGTVSIGGKPEFAAADGKGGLYINVNRGKTNEIVAVDVSARKVVKHMPLKGCEDPTGLAYDRDDDLLISVCDNGVVKFLHREDGREAASLTVGKGADALMFDPQRRLVFVPSADSGTLSVIAVRGAADIAVVQNPPHPGRDASRRRRCQQRARVSAHRQIWTAGPAESLSERRPRHLRDPRGGPAVTAHDSHREPVRVSRPSLYQ